MSIESDRAAASAFRPGMNKRPGLATRLRVLAQQARAYANLAVGHAPPDQVRFVVLAQSRTGSSLLVDLLNAHPDIHCDGELLMHRVYAPRRFVEGSAARAAERAYGFKVKIYQLTSKQRYERPGDFLDALCDRGWLVVHLRRDNLVRQSVSILAAKARGAYSHAISDGPLRDGPLTVDVARMLQILEKRAVHAEAEATCLERVPHLRVCYEDDLLREAAQRATAARLFRLLGVDPDVAVRTKWVRTGRDRLADSIANYAEVEAGLAGTRFAAHLRDSRYEAGALGSSAGA
jgi:LPS sulfotransferase NodH